MFYHCTIFKNLPNVLCKQFQYYEISLTIYHEYMNTNDIINDISKGTLALHLYEYRSLDQINMIFNIVIKTQPRQGTKDNLWDWTSLRAA